MEHLYGDNIGLLHLVASILALVFGTIVLMLDKGTILHKRLGYAYFISMMVLIVTAFMIYRLFNGWGLFHYATLVSLITLISGMIPVLTRRPKGNWLSLHFSFMYWSVMGLYAAFVAETLTRIPNTPFFGMVGIAVFIIMGFAQVAFKKYKKGWKKILNRDEVK